MAWYKDRFLFFFKAFSLLIIQYELMFNVVDSEAIVSSTGDVSRDKVAPEIFAVAALQDCTRAPELPQVSTLILLNFL
jgi:hypothetical protein